MGSARAAAYKPRSSVRPSLSFCASYFCFESPVSLSPESVEAGDFCSARLTANALLNHELPRSRPRTLQQPQCRPEGTEREAVEEGHLGFPLDYQISGAERLDTCELVIKVHSRNTDSMERKLRASQTKPSHKPREPLVRSSDQLTASSSVWFVILPEKPGKQVPCL